MSDADKEVRPRTVADAPASMSAPEMPGATKASVLVLIAEDEEPIAEALAIMVEEAGYHALLARHGKEALDLARTHPPALVITDLMMPYLDGAALIQSLREDAAARHASPPPIILMTAASGRRVEAAQPDALLNKPFELEDIEALLHRFLDSHSDSHSR